MAKYTSTLFKKSKNLNKILVLISILVLTVILSLNNFNPTNVEAHNPDAYPMEIFSLWNNTSPTIDGTIGFTPSSLAGEWSSAAVYNLFDFQGKPDGKLLLQNDNTHLYVAMDAVSYLTADPIGGWGATLYLDSEHYGVLHPNCYAVSFKRNSTAPFYHVEVRQSTGQPDEWVIVDSGAVGVPLPITGIIVNTAFGRSAFNNLTDHRQYEFMIPYATSGLTTGDMFGVGFETYNSLVAIGQMNIWPFVGANPKLIRIDAKYWGDMLIGEQSSYEKYVIEDNFNIKDGAVGPYNGTYLTLANITPDASLELVVMSNRTVAGDTNLISIFDYVDGKIKRIWGSWESTHYSSLFHIIGIAAYDFDEDGSDELYGVSHKDSRIGRLFGWNDVTGDFDNTEIIYDNYGDSMLGYIVIDDVLNEMDGTKQIAFSDEIGWLGFLTYDDKKDEFDLDHYIDPGTNRIHALEVADSDDDGWNELLYFNQYTTDNTMSETNLSIIEYWYFVSPPGSWYENAEDDLPLASTSTTQDQWGHTIVVDDMDNDGWVETIIVGKDYVKIFTPFSFTDPSPPIEFSINDGIIPDAGGGGAAVIDIDGDSYNELIIGCTNGTTIVYEFVDSTFDQEYIPTTFTEEWRADLGLAPGTKNSIIGLDIDEDGFEEAIIGDQFGQILVLGLGPDPIVDVTSPTFGYVTNRDYILLNWQPTNESLPMHHYDIVVNGGPPLRAGGGQQQMIIGLILGGNDIEIYGYDVTGDMSYTYHWIVYTSGAPEVTIYDPLTGTASDSDNIMVYWLATDPDGDSIDFHIYVNGTYQKTVTSFSTNVELKIGGTPFDGWYNITVVADDGNGNLGKDTIWIALDTTAPNLIITSPSDGIAVNVDSIEISWFSWDELAGIDYFEVLRDGISQGFTTDQYFDVNLTSDKSYTLGVIAYDRLGNNQMKTITITRDTIDPTVDFLPLSLPTQDGWYYTDDPIQTIQWDGYDNAGGSGVFLYEVRVNDVNQGFFGWDTNETILDLGGEGFKGVLLIVYDEAGNYAFDYIIIAVDSSDPTIDITSPYNGYVTSDTSVVVTWDSHDNGTGVNYHTIFVDGTPIDYVAGDVDYYSVDIPQNQTYFITIRATDYLGGYTDDTVSVTHDINAPTFLILDPIEYDSYISTTTKNVSWAVINIPADGFDVYVNGTLYASLGSSTFSCVIDFEDPAIFGPISSSEFPLANVTIAVLIGASYQYFDTKWITIDLSNPSVAILDPSHLEIILDDSLYVEWSAYDTGSGIAGFNLWLNGDHIGYYDSGSTSEYIDVSSYSDGLHTLVVEANDIAGNQVNVSVDIELYPQAPEFDVDVPLMLITNDPNYLFNLSIFDPRLGVSEIQIVADASMEVFSLNYNGTYQYDPFWLEIIVTEDVFVAPGDEHNMTITVYDLAARGRVLILDVIVDLIDPVFSGSPIFGDRILSPSVNTVDIVSDTADNIYNISLSATDDHGIDSIYLNVNGDGYNETYQMTFESEIGGIYYTYSYSLDLNNLTNGNYSISFTVFDNAGNAIQSSYDMTIQTAQASPTNWFMEHLYDIVLPSAGGLLFLILFPTILSVATRKRRMNKGWKEALEAVAFVTKTGLTLAYVPYSKNLFEDEQLFGGALTGVVGILGEITGEQEIQMQVHVLEFGDKRLMVCSGYFGNAILLVKDEKPILDDLIKKFLMEFELTYKMQLAQELIDLNEFSAVPLMVESIFGFREQYLKDTLEQYKEEHLTFEQQPTYEEPQPVYEEQPTYQQPQDQEEQYSQEQQQDQQPQDQQFHQERNQDYDEY